MICACVSLWLLRVSTYKESMGLRPSIIGFQVPGSDNSIDQFLAWVPECRDGEKQRHRLLLKFLRTMCSGTARYLGTNRPHLDASQRHRFCRAYQRKFAYQSTCHFGELRREMHASFCDRETQDLCTPDYCL